jgi:hypothetical protein
MQKNPTPDILEKCVGKDGIQVLSMACYLSNNNFAYMYDAEKDYSSELKTENFVPTYDPWCLNCSNKSATKRCSVCRSVYFCNKECQVNAWSIHKKHCKRDLFTLCITCGKQGAAIACDDLDKKSRCPVKFCSATCKDAIYSQHRDMDCNYFSDTFGNK